MGKGLVIRSTGAWYDILIPESQKIFKARLRGKMKLKGSKVTNPVAVGDWVSFVYEEGQKGQVIINEVAERDNYIIRKSTHKTAHSHIIAANLDQVVILATLIRPRTSLGFIDRLLVTAEAYEIPSVILFNKTDLLGEQLFDEQNRLIELYNGIGYSSSSISAIDDPLDKLKTIFQNKKTLIAGHSGVGKSSLINRLIPELALRTSEISDFANKGVHTTTFAEMFQLDRGSYVIDTPGIKEFGLVEIESSELSDFFPEMRILSGSCKFNNCTHVHEPGCAVVDALESGKIAESRYMSYLSMLENYDNRR